MNARTSRLINRYAVAAGKKNRAIKRLWLSTPHNKRHALRKSMHEQARWL